MKKIILIEIVFYLSCINIPAQNYTDSSKIKVVSIYVRNINLDLTTILLQSDISISSDINVYQFGNSYLGLQPGISFLTATALFSDVEGEPFIDISLVGMLSTINQRPFAIQLFLGYNYRVSTKNNTIGYPVNLFKYGLSLGYNVSELIKLYFKYSGVLGDSRYSTASTGIGISFRF